MRAWLHESDRFRELTGQEYDTLIDARGDFLPSAMFRIHGEGLLYYALTWRALAGHGGTYTGVGNSGNEQLEQHPRGTQWVS